MKSFLVKSPTCFLGPTKAINSGRRPALLTCILPHIIDDDLDEEGEDLSDLNPGGAVAELEDRVGKQDLLRDRGGLILGQTQQMNHSFLQQ